MTWPFRTPESASSRASIRPLSSETLSSATEGLLRACASGAPVGLPGDAKARLLAAYERRGGAPSSGLRLVPTILGGLRWQTASLSAAAAAAVVIVVGSLGSGPARPGGALRLRRFAGRRRRATGRVAAVHRAPARLGAGPSPSFGRLEGPRRGRPESLGDRRGLHARSRRSVTPPAVTLPAVSLPEWADARASRPPARPSRLRSLRPPVLALSFRPPFGPVERTPCEADPALDHPDPRSRCRRGPGSGRPRLHARCGQGLLRVDV